MSRGLAPFMALTTPNTNSYRRIRPRCWSGAFRCWGFDNREAAVRVPTYPSPPSPTNLEIKTVDASTDAHAIPELYYLGAKWGRESLAHVLEDAIRSADLTPQEAKHAAERILLENAKEIYLKAI